MHATDAPERADRIAVVIGSRADAVKMHPVIARIGPRAFPVTLGSCDGTGAVDTLRATSPGVVIVQGDSESAVAAALAAKSLGATLVRTDAGLRSFDSSLPDERNRILIDHSADVCAAPTDDAAARLLAEGIDRSKVVVTGSTTVEVVASLLPTEEERLRTRRRLGVQLGRYVVATIRRPENVEDPRALAAILDGLGRCSLPVLMPSDPRTASAVERFGLRTLLGGVRVVDELPHRELIGLLDDAALVVTDSGCVQEEVTVLGRFAIVVRPSTDRPEVLGTFAELAAPGELARRIDDHIESRTRDFLRGLISPFGDGSASSRIATLVTA